MIQLVRHSLDNAPDLRPSSGDVLSKVIGVKKEVDRVYGGEVLKQLDIGNILVAKKIMRMHQRIEELEVSQNLFNCNSKVSIFYLQFHLSFFPCFYSFPFLSTANKIHLYTKTLTPKSLTLDT